MRAFLALTLPDDVERSLAVLQQELAGTGADVKWVAPSNLHVTLKFLDEITEQQRHAIEGVLAEVGRVEAPFSITLDRVGAFPSLSSPRVVWVGVGEGRERVIRLAERLEQGCRGMGIQQEERPFAAHVTLGRVRTPRRQAELGRVLREYAWRPPAPWTITSLTLYQSTLGSDGPRYTVLSDVPLRSA